MTIYQKLNIFLFSLLPVVALQAETIHIDNGKDKSPTVILRTPKPIPAPRHQYDQDSLLISPNIQIDGYSGHMMQGSGHHHTRPPHYPSQRPPHVRPPHNSTPPSHSSPSQPPHAPQRPMHPSRQ